MKYYRVLLLLLLLLIAACSNKEPPVLTVELENPYQLNDLEIAIAGKFSDKKTSHIFYQIEDGHSFLGEGKIDLNSEGGFDTTIELSYAPSNPYGALIFYLDVDNDGIFDPEADISTTLKKIDLVFDEKLVHYGNVEE